MSILHKELIICILPKLHKNTNLKNNSFSFFFIFHPSITSLRDYVRMNTLSWGKYFDALSVSLMLCVKQIDFLVSRVEINYNSLLWEVFRIFKSKKIINLRLKYISGIVYSNLNFTFLNLYQRNWQQLLTTCTLNWNILQVPYIIFLRG